MTQKRTNSNRAVPVVLFGVDDHGKPKAARFAEKDAELAAKAAEQMQLRVVPIGDPRIAELATRLPLGRVHANGHGFVPYIRSDLYAKLLEVTGSAALADHDQVQIAVNASSSRGAANKHPGVGINLPRHWDEIAPGHLVIVQESLEDGWYDALVVDRTGDMLTVRWRDYPRDRKFTRHRFNISLQHPNDAAFSAGSEPAIAASTSQQPKTRPSGKGTAGQSSNVDNAFPQTWDAIDVDHLVLAKQDGPWPGWWEAIPIAKTGDGFTLRWRDYPQLPPIVRPRLSLALLYPNP